MAPHPVRRADRPRWRLSPMRLLLLELVFAALVLGIFLGTRLLGASTQPPRGQECGTIRHATPALRAIHNSDFGSAASVIACFWRAYQLCQPATLVWEDDGADDESTNTLIVVRQEKSCLVYEHDESVANTTRSHMTFTCHSMVRSGETLTLLRCSDPIHDGSTIEPPSCLSDGSIPKPSNCA